MLGWLYPDNRLETFLLPWIICSVATIGSGFLFVHIIQSAIFVGYALVRSDRVSALDAQGGIRPQWMERLNLPTLLALWLIVTALVFYTAATIVGFVFGPGSEHLKQISEGIEAKSFWLQMWVVVVWVTAITSTLLSMIFAWWTQRKLILVSALTVAPFQLWLWAAYVLGGVLY